MNMFLFEDKLLIRDGKLAMDEDCCCEIDFGTPGFCAHLLAKKLGGKTVSLELPQRAATIFVPGFGDACVIRCEDGRVIALSQGPNINEFDDTVCHWWYRESCSVAGTGSTLQIQSALAAGTPPAGFFFGFEVFNGTIGGGATRVYISDSEYDGNHPELIPDIIPMHKQSDSGPGWGCTPGDVGVDQLNINMTIS